MYRLHGRTFAALAWAVVGMACGDASTAPSAGTIRVTTRTTGGDPDADGYTVVLSTGIQRLISGSETVDIPSILPGPYSVTLQGVAANCSVSGDSTHAITVTAGKLAATSFDVVCAATGVGITIRATGKDIPKTYHLTLGQTTGPQIIFVGSESVLLDADSSVVVSRLQAGSYVITLAPPSDNCSVTGGRQVTVDVTLRSVTKVLFDIACTPATRSEKIAFAFDTTVNGSAESWIGLVNPDGTGRTVLVPGDSPAWSRGRDKVVFSTVQCFPDPYYYYYSDCLGGVALIDPEIGNDSTLTQGKNGFGPVWSPTTDSIVFWQQPGTLFLLPPNGSAPLAYPRFSGLDARDPAWAPDGRRLAFTCAASTNIAQICIFDSTLPLVPLTTTGTHNAEPAWSPDGSRIAFTSDSMVAVVNVSTGGVTMLTHGLSPDWSRDGTKLVFADVGGLYTINADGTSRQRLTSGQLRAPAWRR